jgi:hypothetical protein
MLLRDFEQADQGLSQAITLTEEEGSRNPWAYMYRG